MALPRALISALEIELSTSILSFQAISGGDINRAFRLETNSCSYFLKYNAYPQGSDMLRTEKRGLVLLAASQSIAIPQPIAQNSAQAYHYLILQDWKAQRKAPNFWEDFGRQLANLHRHSAPKFGLDHDNFIATVPQSNRQHQTWSNFYWQERLFPLLRKAMDQQLIDQEEAKVFERFDKRLEELFPDSVPALVHGDLWNGNYMVAPNGQAGLIDPAVYYGHREMDLSMTKLFGGFHPTFYNAYAASYPLDPDWEDRTGICQLYPLLVHLLLFGRAYWGSIKAILAPYH